MLSGMPEPNGYLAAATVDQMSTLVASKVAPFSVCSLFRLVKRFFQFLDHKKVIVGLTDLFPHNILKHHK